MISALRDLALVLVKGKDQKTTGTKVKVKIRKLKLNLSLRRGNSVIPFSFQKTKKSRRKKFQLLSQKIQMLSLRLRTLKAEVNLEGHRHRKLV